MVEVFKTNVTDVPQARMLLDSIHERFRDVRANFDLDDCDRILRIVNEAGPVRTDDVIGLLADLGFRAEVLPDELVHFPERTTNLLIQFPLGYSS